MALGAKSGLSRWPGLLIFSLLRKRESRAGKSLAGRGLACCPAQGATGGGPPS